LRKNVPVTLPAAEVENFHPPLPGEYSVDDLPNFLTATSAQFGAEGVWIVVPNKLTQGKTSASSHQTFSPSFIRVAEILSPLSTITCDRRPPLVCKRVSKSTMHHPAFLAW
jgi:hypothetical protein